MTGTAREHHRGSARGHGTARRDNHARRTGRVRAKTMPTITDKKEVVIEFTTGPDDLGRCRFYAYWLENTGRRRGQVFYIDPNAFAKRCVAEGRTVRYWQAP